MDIPTQLDLRILKEVQKEPGKSIRSVCDRFFPEFSETWVRSRVRALLLAGLLERTSRGYAHTIACTTRGLEILEQGVAAK